MTAAAVARTREPRAVARRAGSGGAELAAYAVAIAVAYALSDASAHYALAYGLADGLVYIGAFARAITCINEPDDRPAPF